MLKAYLEDTSTPHSSLEFGVLLDGQAEILVTNDMFGFHLFYFDDVDKTYTEKPKDLLWRIPISMCRNLENSLNFPLPNNGHLRQYWESGLDSLGYVSAVNDNPEFSDYVDNPGILILLIADISKAKGILAENPDRIELVRNLAGNKHICKFHIKWLKKIHVGTESPRQLAANIKASLLRIKKTYIEPQQHRHLTQLFKLFAHQTEWTPLGLDLARILMHRPKDSLADVSRLLSEFNGNISEDKHRLVSALNELKISKATPKIVAERATFLLSSTDFLTIELAQKLLRTVRKAKGDIGFLNVCLHFINDGDIPTPILKGNQQITPLDTMDKIRGHSRKVKNCVWSLDIIKRILSREIDMYSVKGENIYTISITRRTLDIGMIEAAKPTQIKPRDLVLISDWFENATRLPR